MKRAILPILFLFLLIVPLVPSSAYALKLTVYSGDVTTSTNNFTPVNPVALKEVSCDATKLPPESGACPRDVNGKPYISLLNLGVSGVTINTCTTAQGCSGQPARIYLDTSGGVNKAVLTDADIILTSISTRTFVLESACGEFPAAIGNNYPYAAAVNATSLTSTGTPARDNVVKLLAYANALACTGGVPQPKNLVNTSGTEPPSTVCPTQTAFTLAGKCSATEQELTIPCGDSSTSGNTCVPTLQSVITLTAKRGNDIFRWPGSGELGGAGRPTSEGGFLDLIAGFFGTFQFTQWPPAVAFEVNHLSPTGDASSTQRDIPIQVELLRCLLDAQGNCDTSAQGTVEGVDMVSILSDDPTTDPPAIGTSTANNSSVAGFGFAPGTKVKNLTELSASWTYSLGDCAKSWGWEISVNTSPGPKKVFFDYGENFSSDLDGGAATVPGYQGCTGVLSGVNIMDLRGNPGHWDLTEFGGPVDGTLSQMLSTVGRNTPVRYAALVLRPQPDQNPRDQKVNVTEVKFNGQSFKPITSFPAAITCDHPGGITFKVFDSNGTMVKELVQGDAKDEIQSIGCKLQSHLPTEDLVVGGTYQILVFLNELPLPRIPSSAEGTFTLK